MTTGCKSEGAEHYCEKYKPLATGRMFLRLCNGSDRGIWHYRILNGESRARRVAYPGFLLSDNMAGLNLKTNFEGVNFAMKKLKMM